MNELQGFTCVTEARFDLCLDGIKPCHHFGGRWPSPDECACRPYLVARFIGAFGIARKCRNECHVRENGRTEQWVLSILRGLESGNEAGLRLRRVLQVEEFDSAGKQA